MHIYNSFGRLSEWKAFNNLELYSDYVEKLGSLILLEKTINTSISNGVYSKKLPCYAQSAYLLTRSLIEKPKVGTNTKLNKAVENLIPFANWNSHL